MNPTCVNCGYDYALHHYDTTQCPKGGEAPVGRKQEWLETIYLENQEKIKIENIEKEIEQLKAEISTIKEILKRLVY